MVKESEDVMKKKIVSVIGVICLIVLVVGFYLWMDEEATKLHFKKC